MSDDYVTALHTEVREELNRIDSKVSVLLAVFGIAVSVVSGAMITGAADPRDLTDVHEVAFWVAATLALGGIGLLVAALHPVTRHHEPRNHLRYFGHVAQYVNVNAFREALDATDRQEHNRRVEQTYMLSRIVVRKYRLTTIAISLYGASILLGLFAATDA